MIDSVCKASTRRLAQHPSDTSIAMLSDGSDEAEEPKTVSSHFLPNGAPGRGFGQEPDRTFEFVDRPNLGM